ncbi:hypothetical protein EHP00_1190 [Ecytonucleospora hepatopenaei]|uniref:Uncharacterized protein n=1 Tax=Ecytonucleospora hepatopenaei TaxID=646526 RepID=A0A1W0E8H2_9MICR|nr:hypothetical protein EHP00_1190 [Ecytonucleospora hepatopenaei]
MIIFSYNNSYNAYNSYCFIFYFYLSFITLINTSFINYHDKTVNYLNKSIKLYDQLIELEKDQTENINEFFNKIRKENNKVKYKNTSTNNIKLLWNEKIKEFNIFIDHSNVILSDMEKTISFLLILCKNISISENKRREFIFRLAETESKRTKVLLEILTLKSYLITYKIE